MSDDLEVCWSCQGSGMMLGDNGDPCICSHCKYDGVAPREAALAAGKEDNTDYAASYKLHATIREAALREAAWCFDDDVGHPSKARAAILALINGESK